MSIVQLERHKCDQCGKEYEPKEDQWVCDECEENSMIEVCRKCNCRSTLKKQFDEFVKNQKSIDKEFVDLVNKHFWDLI